MSTSTIARFSSRIWDGRIAIQESADSADGTFQPATDDGSVKEPVRLSRRVMQTRLHGRDAFRFRFGERGCNIRTRESLREYLIAGRGKLKFGDLMDLVAENIEMLCQVAEVRRINRAISASLAEVDRASFVVTSASRGEGKSSVASLLAAAAAVLQGKKVLAVDLNWHRPTLHSRFGLDLSLRCDKLQQGGNPLDQVMASGIAGLDILSAPKAVAGTTIPALDSSRLALSLLEKLRDSYELLLVDTSSIFPTNRFMIDPILISAACDGVVLVVMAGITPRQEVKRSLVNLEIAGANVLGAVVNQWQNPIDGGWRFQKES